MSATLGVLMLDTAFPRVRGDVGNPQTFPFPVRFHVVAGATPEAIVCADPTPFTDAFITAGKALVADGCSGIATTCGFLSLIRPQLAKAIGVPVASSALEQAGQIDAMLGPDRCVGILTINAATLSPQHLAAAGVPAHCPIVGVQESAFARSILGNKSTLDVAAAEKTLLEAAQRMICDHPHVGAILLECTNMPPYAGAIAAATGRPVFDITTYLNWFHAGLVPARFQS